MLEIKQIDENIKDKRPFTALIYCAPGVGKSTAIGLAAENTKGKTLVLDVDRTIDNTIAKKEVVHDSSRLYTVKIDNTHGWDDWMAKMTDLKEMHDNGKLDFETIAVDNLSELERCILADLGSKGKNKGVPAMADYQYMQYKLVNSVRFLKSLGCNVIFTAWETVGTFTHPDGTTYSRVYPKISEKILDNVLGLCDVVGKLGVNKDGEHKILLEATQNIIAKNQLDTRKVCDVQDFVKFEFIKEDK